MSKYEKYMHHGREVWTASTLKGTHREHCLCFDCLEFDITDRAKNCLIANALYDNCVKFSVTAPVFECPNFKSKSDVSVVA